MKISYVTTYDASDIRAWSGSAYYISESLKRSGFSIEYIGNLKEPLRNFFRIKKVLYGTFLSKNYLRDREPRILKSYAKQVKSALSRVNSDIVFSPGTIPIAYLTTDLPIVFWTDATFAGMIDFYPSFSNLCKESVRSGNTMEQEALSKCRLAIYNSEWAAKTAIDNYDVDHRKVKVVPFGSNIDNELKLSDIETITKNKDFTRCKLLFIGVDWFRKGGDIALRVATLLNEQGLATELHIVGCTPQGRLPDFVFTHGFVSKRTEEGKKLLQTLFTGSHFLILPSRAECCAVVLAEASSYGLPSLTSDVGGITTAIRNGRNGWAFPLTGIEEKFCDYVTKALSSPTEYARLSASSYTEYTERLNWFAAGNRIRELIHEFCG
jgi:glycosyltransferase involved in cell wall biosynthesis